MDDFDTATSCHVFRTLPSKFISHVNHVVVSTVLNVRCVRDCVTGECLQFPSSSRNFVSTLNQTLSSINNVVQPSFINNGRFDFYPNKYTANVGSSDFEQENKSEINFKVTSQLPDVVLDESINTSNNYDTSVSLFINILRTCTNIKFFID